MRLICTCFIALLLCLGTVSCATLDEFTGGGLGSGGGGGGGLLTNLNLLSTGEEIRLGQQVAVEVEKQEKILEDPAMQQYISEIGVRLAQVAPRQDVPYGFKVIDAPDTVNAFALPGGFMYIYTGLMKICDNEAELAAVMAHEIAHVAARHHGEMMTRQIGMDVVSDIVLGKNPGAVASVARQLFTTGIAARYSRSQEREADSLGMDILYRAGYPPDAMISFMNKLLVIDQQRGGGRALPIFATHPSPEERVGLLQSLAQQYPLEARQNRPSHADRYQAQVLGRL